MGDLVPALAQASLPMERRDLLAKAGSPAELAPRIQAAVVSSLYSDPAQAARLVAAGRELADLCGNSLAAAYARRGEAHLAFVQGDYAGAAKMYGEAADAFAALPSDVEEARTRSSGLQALIYLGRYDEAREWAERAEAIFLRNNDALRLARLDSNVGNIYFRLDQPRQAIARYERALETLNELGDDKDVAAALNNLVVGHTSLGQFREALGYYERVRQHCLDRKLAPLSAQADYNIAYLYFQRGDYPEARKAYQRSREICASHGDAYHAALCDLDESELALELNLSQEGELLARRAAAGFERLGMRYEQAKALVSLAVSASQSGASQRASRLLMRARVLFAAEGNSLWPSLIDLLRANLAYQSERFRHAQRLSASAWEVLSASTMVPSRAAHCQLLLARVWLRVGQADRARAVGRDAVAKLGSYPSPSLLFHAHLLEGEVNEMQGRWPQAFASYGAAREVLEDLRGRLDTEDLRISLLKDKLAVYEALVSMCLDSPLAVTEDYRARAMLMVQQAKSRSLADRLLQPSRAALSSADAGGGKLGSLRRDLNWHYRQIDLAALLQHAGGVSVSSTELRRGAERLEGEVLAEQSRVQSGAETPFLAPAETLGGLQEMIPDGCAVLEYFEARGVLSVFVLRRGALDVMRLGPSAAARQALKLLQFQLGKVPQESARAWKGRQETGHHLAELYDLLVRPVECRLAGCHHLVFAPHRQLHGLPFAALHDGSGALMERFTISYAPSASVYSACRRRRGPQPDGACVIAVPDPSNPHIETEARAVAQRIPNARLVLADDATCETFLREAAHIGTLHLAAHGVFRRDNPAFSSIQLADGRLSLLDLAPARLDVGLLTVSACSSGLSVPVGGDELLGLTRGFLAAGVRRMVVSLWEVDDAATGEFMCAFYGLIQGGAPAQVAMQSAMREVRNRYPHPYHWAPFMLVGDTP